MPDQVRHDEVGLLNRRVNICETSEEMILKYTLAWVPMVVIGIVNGAIRQFGCGRILNELLSHQVSSVTGIIFFGLYIWFLTLRWPLESSRQALVVGLIWLGLTIAFEFLFGHYVAGHPWSRLIHDYNILKGRLWSLVLIAVAIAPYLIYRIRS